MMTGRLDRKDAIEPGPTVRFDLGGEAAADVQVSSWSELDGDQVARAAPG